MTTSMGRWSGSGFSFHAWICLENPPSSMNEFGSARRQLYKLVTLSQIESNHSSSS